MDPFEEIGIAEKNAEQHRRSATEKEVWQCACVKNYHELLSVSFICLLYSK